MSSTPPEPNIDDSSARHGRDLTTGSIPRHLIAYSIPMLVGNAIQAGHSIINAYWVGKGLGDDAMAAIAVSFPVFFVLLAIAIGLTMAAGILAAQAYGAKDWARLKLIVQNSFVLVGASSILCVVSGHILAEPLLRLMDTDPSILPMAASYLRLFVWSTPFMFGIFLIASLLRGMGDSKTPLYFQSAFLGLNAILDPLLIFGWLGLPRMGLNGTAVATIISNAGAMVAILIYLHRKNHVVTPDWRRFRLDSAMVWLNVKIGVPAMFQNALVSIGLAVIVGIVNSFGKTGVAAFGIASRIDQFAFLPAMTIGMAVSTLAGQNIGAGRYHRVKEVFKWGLVLGCGMAFMGTVVFVTIPGTLMAGFTDSPEVIALGTRYFRIVGGGYVVLAALFVCNGVINGAGRTLITTLATGVGLWGVRLPLAAYLSGRLNSLDGVWYAMVGGFTAGLLLSLAYYLSGKWKSPVISKVAPPPVEDLQPIEIEPYPGSARVESEG